MTRELGLERYKGRRDKACWATVGTLNLNAVRSHGVGVTRSGTADLGPPPRSTKVT